MTILGNTWRILQLSRPTLQSEAIFPMISKSQSRVARPMDRSKIERQELAGAIRRALPRDGRVEMQPGLTLFRVSTPTEPVYGVSESSFCVIAQGAKHVMLGEDRFRY